jgi:hypothetical protein
MTTQSEKRMARLIQREIGCCYTQGLRLLDNAGTRDHPVDRLSAPARGGHRDSQRATMSSRNQPEPGHTPAAAVMNLDALARDPGRLSSTETVQRTPVTIDGYASKPKLGNEFTISIVLTLTVTIRFRRSTMYRGSSFSVAQSLGSLTIPLALSVFT